MNLHKDYLVSVYDKEGEMRVSFSLYKLRNLSEARIEADREINFHYKTLPDFIRVEIKEW